MLINFPHSINPPGKNPVNKNGVVYVDLLYRMMSEERHCVMLLMFVYGELSSKKNKQKNVHLLPPKKCVQFLKRKPFFFLISPIKKGEKKHIQSQHLTLKASLRSPQCLGKNYFKTKQKKGYHASLGTRESINKSCKFPQSQVECFQNTAT